MPFEFFFGIIGLMAVTLPFVFAGFTRYLRYRETVHLANRGLLHERYQDKPRSNGKNTLRWGIIITALGVALTCGSWPIGFFVDEAFLGLGPWMLVGFLPLAFGISLLLINHLVDEDDEDDEDDDPPLLEEIPTSGPYGVGIDHIPPAYADDYADRQAPDEVE